MEYKYILPSLFLFVNVLDDYDDISRKIRKNREYKKGDISDYFLSNVPHCLRVVRNPNKIVSFADPGSGAFLTPGSGIQDV
jgi:hypothetical protein